MRERRIYHFFFFFKYNSLRIEINLISVVGGKRSVDNNANVHAISSFVFNVFKTAGLEQILHSLMTCFTSAATWIECIGSFFPSTNY